MSPSTSACSFNRWSPGAFLVLAGTLISLPLQADTCTWDGTDGNWNDSARWSCGHEPGVGDSAIINGGDVFVTVATTVDSLTFTGGSLEGGADIEITAMLTWTGGGMRDTGKTTVAEGATWTMSGSTTKVINRRFDNAGAATWSWTGNFNHFGAFTNLSTGTVTIENDRNFGQGPGTTFINDGVITKTGGSGETHISALFTQSSTGSVEVQDGTLRFSGGGTIDGSITANGATIGITARALTFVATASLTATNLTVSGGSSTLTLELGGANFTVTNITQSQGVLSFTGPAVSFPNLIMTGGQLRGSADVEVTDQLSWVGGSMTEPGKTIVAQSAAMTMSGSTTKALSRTLHNAGMTTWSWTGTVNLFGTFVNLSTGTVTIENDKLFGQGPGSTFTNDGVITKTGGSGETRISAVFTQGNTGSLEVQDGSFNFDQDSNFAGSLVANGTRVLFANGNATFSDDVDFQVTNLEIDGDSVDMSNITDLTLVNVLQTGGTFTLDHPSVLVEGDFVRTSGTFVHGKGKLIFGSGGEQNLSLSDPTEFFLLEVTPGTTLVETGPTDHASVAGFLKNRGTIRKTQDIPAVGNVTFGLTNIELDIVDPGTLMSLQVDRIGTTHPNAAAPTIREQYWELLPTGGGYEVDLTIHHCFQPDAELLICQFANPNWSCENQMSTPTSITQVGVTQFRDTALGSDDYHSMTQFECGNVSAWSDVRGLC